MNPGNATVARGEGASTCQSFLRQKDAARDGAVAGRKSYESCEQKSCGKHDILLAQLSKYASNLYFIKQPSVTELQPRSPARDGSFLEEKERPNVPGGP